MIIILGSVVAKFAYKILESIIILMISKILPLPIHQYGMAPKFHVMLRPIPQ